VGDADTHAPRKGDKNINVIRCYGQTSTLGCLASHGDNVWTPASENLHCCYFFFVFFGVFFFGGFFLPGPLCGMSLLLSPGYRFCATPIRNIKLATRGSECSPSNAGAVFR
jgi:hypothetical protein